ncbi:MAG: glyoxalase superfamily protein [Paracoccaceae bacterium]
MTTIFDAKPMAKSLRKALAEQDLRVSHSESLELVSKQFGYANWNTLSAKITANIDDGLLVQPRNWTLTSNTKQQHYRFGLDPQMGGAAMLESKSNGTAQDTGEFASYMQSVSAEKFLGHRVRLTGNIRTKDADSGTIWMRVDHQSGNVMRFDNMGRRKSEGTLHGTQDWSEREVVLDVPDDAATVHYGFLLKNRGKMWARSFALEIVETTVATTESADLYLERPVNLDFSQM